MGACCQAVDPLKNIHPPSQACSCGCNQRCMALDEFLSRYIEDAKDRKDFVRLLKSADAKKENSLLDELVAGAKVQLAEFRFAESSQKPIGQGLISVDGYGHGSQRRFCKGAFHDSEERIPVTKIMDSEGRFAFAGQLHSGQRHFNLILAEVAPEFRGEGLFQQLFKALCWYAFEEIGVASIHGRAAIPRVSLFGESAPASEEWRMRPELLWDEVSKRGFRTTQLLHMWLKQPNCYPRFAIDEEAGSDEFIIIKPELFQCFNPIERQKLRDAYPKPRPYSPVKVEFKSALAY